MDSNTDAPGAGDPSVDAGGPGDARAADPLEPAGAQGVSRRLLIIGGVAVVVAAGGGVVAGIVEHVSGSTAAPPSRAAAKGLTDALDAERRLVIDVANALAAGPAQSDLHSTLTQVHRDHVAHVRALAALVAEGSTPTRASASATGSTRPRRNASGRAALHAAETAAADRAATLATTMTGPAATVLASIAACEATHAELLT